MREIVFAILFTILLCAAILYGGWYQNNTSYHKGYKAGAADMAQVRFTKGCDDGILRLNIGDYKEKQICCKNFGGKAILRGNVKNFQCDPCEKSDK